jgi:hypothetical protein
MIAHLASTLVDRYASDATHLVDPFCGSGAVLKAGSQRGKRVTGIDLNPFGVLLTSVKLQGFDSSRAASLCKTLLTSASESGEYPVQWQNKDIWFTPATLRKYERIRYVARDMQLHRSKAGRAVLLALGLSVRRCSRSDQRSPKPFMSKYARKSRSGRHFDPARTMTGLLNELTDLYGKVRTNRGDVHQLDVTSSRLVREAVSSCSHIITSPPYINAQDYFRNFKLELYLLEGLLPYRVDDIIHRFVGTERGVGRGVLTDPGADERRQLVPELRYLERAKEEQAVVVHRYLQDMTSAFGTMKTLVGPGGVVVVVCGDNLIGGRRICTWRVLNSMLEGMGFIRFDSFGDRIRNRAVAPMRCGHKGIIKQEIVSAFRLLK